MAYSYKKNNTNWPHIIAIAVIIVAILIGALFLINGSIQQTQINQTQMNETGNQQPQAILNAGCITYLLQNPACSDSNSVSVNYQGSTMSLKKFLNCSDENCVRSACSCSGY